MSKPLSEPSQGRENAYLGWNTNQLQRRPAVPMSATGLATGAFNARMDFLSPPHSGQYLLVDSGATVTAPLPIVAYDVSGWYDNGTYTYTAGLDGIYRFSVSLTIGSTDSFGAPDDGRITDRGVIAAILAVNPGGSEVDSDFGFPPAMSIDPAGARVYGGFACTGTLDQLLVAGDEVQLQLYQSNTVDYWKLTMSVWAFSGQYMGAAV